MTRLVDLNHLTLMFAFLKYIASQLLLSFAYVIALIILPTLSPSLSILLPAISVSLLTSHPHAEILYIQEFIVYHTDWLQSTHTDAREMGAFHFFIFNRNKLSDVLHLFLIVMTMQKTLDLFCTSNF